MVRKLNGERREIDKKQEGYRKVRYERNIHIHQFILALLRLEIFYGMEENVKLHICSVQRRAETEQSWHSCLILCAIQLSIRGLRRQLLSTLFSIIQESNASPTPILHKLYLFNWQKHQCKVSLKGLYGKLFVQSKMAVMIFRIMPFLFPPSQKVLS